MPRGQFQALATRLLDSGIARKYVIRIRAELRDHYADLLREARAANSSPTDAVAEARARLGKQALIAEEFLARPELRSWVYRSQWIQICIQLAVSITVLLIHPFLALIMRRAAVARYGAAITFGTVATCGTFLMLQLVITAGSVGGDRISRAGAITLNVTPQTAVAVEEPTSAIDDEIGRLRFLSDRADQPDLPDLPDLPVLSGLGGDPLPIVKVAAVYPSLAAARGLEGYVVLEFTVTRTGTVRNVVVVESTDTIFEGPAIAAAYKFKYKPGFIDGKPVDVSGIRNKITFELAA